MDRPFRIVVAGTLLVVVLGVVLLAYGEQLWRYVECERVDETNALGVRRVYFVKRWGEVADRRHGPYLEYWPNGVKKHEAEYVNGQSASQGRFWNPDGRVVAIRLPFYDTAK